MDKRLIILLLVTVGIFVLYLALGPGKKHQGPRPPEPEKAAPAAAPQPADEGPAKERPLEGPGKRSEERFAVLETDQYKATFSTHGGSLVSWQLKDPRYRVERDGREQAIEMVTTNTGDFEENNPLRLELVTGGEDVPIRIDYHLDSKSAEEVRFTYADSRLRIVRKHAPAGEPYQLWSTSTIRNVSSEPVTIKPAILMQGYQDPGKQKGGFLAAPPDIQRGVCRAAGQTFHEAASDIERAYAVPAEVSFTGVDTNFFLGALIPSEPRTEAGCYVWVTPLRVIRSEIQFGRAILQPGEEALYRVRVYMGPKLYGLLQRTGSELDTAVDLGWFAPICKVLLWLLRVFQGWVVNWGVAIILLTILVKLLLWPLTTKSYASMSEMKRLKPLIDEINKTYKDDNQKKSEAMMALYKEHKINPLGGCLPMLLQMPIWFALYRTLASAAELYRAPFALWIRDLSAPDPYYITPIILGASMFIQQKITPTPGDSAQAKMMLYFMPAMFTVFMLFLPSGLTLYILVNTFLGIAQQQMYNRPKGPPSEPVAHRRARSSRR